MRAQARDADAAAAAAGPELQKLLNDFQENIGTLTGMAQRVIGQLAEKHGADWVRDAIQEAVIYEKRSLAYVRRVLEAWRRNGRMTGRNETTSSSREWMWSNYPTDVQPEDSDLPLFKLNNDVQIAKSDMSTPAVAAWEAMNREVPQLGRFRQFVTPVSLIDNVLTVTVPNTRTYTALTFLMACATESVLGKGVALKVEMAGESESLFN